MMEIVAGAGLFTAIVFILALVVLIAQSLLRPGGDATVTINDSRQITAAAGASLLEALLANAVFLPSACAGKGSCGQCRVNVQEGGGSMLPIEESFISRREAASGWRLACQVPLVAGAPVRLRLPESVFSARRYRCRVRASYNVATYIRELTLELAPGQSLEFQAGGYIMVHCPAHRLRLSAIELSDDYRGEWQRFGLLDTESVVAEPQTRAYSLANYPGEQGIVMLDVRLATVPPSAPPGTPIGQVSSWLFGLKAGEEVTISGPYGEFNVNDSEAEMIFVGGGAGMAPLRSHIFDQLKRAGTSRRMSYWYGARSLREAFYIEEFEQLASEHANFEWHLALSEPAESDNWTGLTGFIHEVLLEQYLNEHPAPEDCEYYLCGPPMMIAALIDLFDQLGVAEQNIYFDDFGSRGR